MSPNSWAPYNSAAATSALWWGLGISHIPTNQKPAVLNLVELRKALPGSMIDACSVLVHDAKTVLMLDVSSSTT